MENLTVWFFSHGVKVILILVAAFVLTRVSRVFIKKFLKNFLKLRNGIKLSQVENIKLEEKKLKTLEKVSFSVSKIIIWLIALVTLLPELGVNIGPLLAGIGIGGLALGFGARSLVQDYISGIFILLEDQYRVGEEVEVAGKKGKVKDFNLRTTVIEDENGVLSFIPNSQIKKASNFSR